MNMIFYIEIAISIAMVLFTLSLTIWLVSDIKKQKILVDGLKYRKEHGRFDFDQYVTGEKKPIVSCRQENNGIDPNAFNTELKCVNYFPFILDDEKKGK